MYPNDCRLDDSIEAVQIIGMRFHAARGSMSVGQSKGGLPPDRVVEEEGAILKDSQRLIETCHDAGRYAMQRIVVAPCSPFSVSRDLMKEAAGMARSYGVSLHTRLAENASDIAYSREKFNMTPAEYAEDCGWVGHDVLHAHCVQLDDAGVYMFGRTGTGHAVAAGGLRSGRDDGAPGAGDGHAQGGTGPYGRVGRRTGRFFCVLSRHFRASSHVDGAGEGGSLKYNHTNPIHPPGDDHEST